MATVDAAYAAHMAQYAKVEETTYGADMDMERDGVDPAEIRMLRAEKHGIKHLR
jgi:hypothetical protein